LGNNMEEIDIVSLDEDKEEEIAIDEEIGEN
jgi:hypothetical protein